MGVEEEGGGRGGGGEQRFKHSPSTFTFTPGSEAQTEKHPNSSREVRGSERERRPLFGGGCLRKRRPGTAPPPAPPLQDSPKGPLRLALNADDQSIIQSAKFGPVLGLAWIHFPPRVFGGLAASEASKAGEKRRGKTRQVRKGRILFFFNYLDLKNEFQTALVYPGNPAPS